jgi:hypothetical protein
LGRSLRREEDALGRQVAGDRRGRGVLGVALGPALQQVEVVPVRGELDVDRGAELRPQESHELRDLRHERRVLEDALERDDELVLLPVRLETHRTAHAVVVDDREDLARARELLAVVPDQVVDPHGREGVLVQVQDVHHLRRVTQDLVRRDVHSQLGLSRGHEDGVVVGHPVDRPRAQAGHHADQAVLAADPARPAELVVAEGHAAVGGEEVAAHRPPHHLLDHDPNLLVHVEEAALRAVLDGIG